LVDLCQIHSGTGTPNARNRSSASGSSGLLLRCIKLMNRVAQPAFDGFLNREASKAIPHQFTSNAPCQILTLRWYAKKAQR
jgi:hypothetical protein